MPRLRLAIPSLSAILDPFRHPGLGAPSAARIRIQLPRGERLIYAVGDVHGCLAQLVRLEDMILRDAESMTMAARTIVLLGDLVDRGPQTAEVLAHLMRPVTQGFSRIVLAGNHEVAMLAAFSQPGRAGPWLDLGGLETLRSYGLDVGVFPTSRRELDSVMLQARSLVPNEHLEFLRGLPVAVAWERYRFVHAGCRPGVAFADQGDTDLVGIREPFLSCWGDGEEIVVHGHTPAAEPRQVGARIGVDTCCYATGRLSAARVERDGVKFFTASAS